MKKLSILFISLLIFSEGLIGCTNEAQNTGGSNSVKTADEEFSFLLINKVDQNHPFTSSFEDNTWYCVVSKYRKLDGTVEENKHAYFCVYVENNNKWKYYCYPLSGEHGANNNLDNMSGFADAIEYWCKIDTNLYNTYKNKLPECVSKAPSEWSDLTEEQEYEFFYNKIAAYTWVDNNVDFSYSNDENMKKIIKAEIKKDSGNNLGLQCYENNNQKIGDFMTVFNYQNVVWKKINSNKWKSDQIDWILELNNTNLQIIMIYDNINYNFSFIKQ